MSKIGTGECGTAKLARKRGIARGAVVEGGMSLEVLVPGEATVADVALKGLEGRTFGLGDIGTGTGNRHDGREWGRGVRNNN